MGVHIYCKGIPTIKVPITILLGDLVSVANIYKKLSVMGIMNNTTKNSNKLNFNPFFKI